MTWEKPCKNAPASWREKLPKLLVSVRYRSDACSVARTNAGAEMNNGNVSIAIGKLLQPIFAVVICAPESMAADVLVIGNLQQCALQFFFRQIERIIVNWLANLFESIEEERNFAQISALRPKQFHISAWS